MTEFLDILETQLDTAARRRYSPRRASRRLFGEIAVAAVAITAVAAVVVVLGGRTTAEHAARTPVAPTTGVGIRGLRVAVLNATTVAGAGRAVADRLTAGGAHIVRVTGDLQHDLDFTEVVYRFDHAADGLAVSRFLGGISGRDAALRVFPLKTHDPHRGGVAVAGADVIVRVGVANHFGEYQLRADQSTFTVGNACPSGARPLSSWDAQEAAYAVIHHSPAAEEAVLGADPTVIDDCGDRATVLVPIVLTRTGQHELLWVSCAGDHWVAWRTAQGRSK